ncbi:hypothetical protein LINGRAHAP2_LOCUS27489, partial [Linum grandiflorum]
GYRCFFSSSLKAIPTTPTNFSPASTSLLLIHSLDSSTTLFWLLRQRRWWLLPSRPSPSCL